jgi:hypothetical protein
LALNDEEDFWSSSAVDPQVPGAGPGRGAKNHANTQTKVFAGFFALPHNIAVKFTLTP